MMLTVSDNAATDVLIDRVGLDELHATLASLGLPRTVISTPLREELDSIGQDAGFGGWAEATAAPLSAEDERRVQRLILRARALDPRHSIRTTACEMATLLRLIWRDEAGPAAVCAPLRQMMARQVTQHPPNTADDGVILCRGQADDQPVVDEGLEGRPTGPAEPGICLA